MTDPLACVVTNGGPLIAIPGELLGAWRGVLPPDGAVVPTGWTWGDGGIVCDYDRACDPPTDPASVGDSYGTWTVQVGQREALVLEGECPTTALRWDDGLVIVRDVGLATYGDVLAMIAEVPESGWLQTAFALELEGGSVFIFDSAYGGLESDDADGGVLEATLASGTYRVHVAVPRAGERTTLVRLVGLPQSERGLRGISVR